MSDSRKRSYQKRRYYVQDGKKKPFYLEAGVKGFFCTCNFQEKNCVREAYNLLNEFSPPEPVAQPETQENEDELDVSSCLEKQISEIKSEDRRNRRFQCLDTSVPNCVFIQANVDDTVELGHRIVRSIADTKVSKSRFLLRIVPIEATCSAKIKDIVDTSAKLFDKHFLCEPTTFSIVFNRRYNNSICRDDIIKELADLVVSKNPGHKADLSNPKQAVIVEILKGICLISVVPDYFALKKYNIVELCNKPAPTEDAPKNEAPEAENN